MEVGLHKQYIMTDTCLIVNDMHILNKHKYLTNYDGHMSNSQRHARLCKQTFSEDEVTPKHTVWSK